MRVVLDEEPGQDAAGTVSHQRYLPVTKEAQFLHSLLETRRLADGIQIEVLAIRQSKHVGVLGQSLDEKAARRLPVMEFRVCRQAAMDRMNLEAVNQHHG